MNDKKTVLVVGMGTSPAVLTETVWALAHQSEPVVPDEVIVITTKSGKDALRTAIMSGASSVWNRLKTALAKEKIAIDGKLVFGDTSIRVIPDADGNEASDLRTGADNLRAADFMLTSIQVKHSQKPIVSGSMKHAFLFADESENGCSQSLFYVRRTSQNGWSRDVLHNWLSTDLYERVGKTQTSFVCCGCVFSSIIRRFVNNSQWSANYENYKKSPRGN